MTLRHLIALVSMLPCFVVGCAAPKRPLLQPSTPPLVWPTPPDTPRVQFLGELRGSDDLQRAKTFGEHWDELLHGPTPPERLVSPHAVTIHTNGQRVAVADTGGRCVHMFDLSAQTHHRVTNCANRSSLIAPSAVAWVDDALWIADAQAGRITAIGADGSCRLISDDSMERPSGIAYDRTSGRCYVTDAGAHRIVAFDTKGLFVMSIGERGGGPGQFNYPSHIACTADGKLVVSDSLNFRIQVLGADGTPLQMFGRKGDAAGDISLPKGVAVDAAGHVWVVDANFENVQAFTLDGQLLMSIGGEGREPGKFWLPAGICIDAQSRMWIADTYNRRVQVFELMG